MSPKFLTGYGIRPNSLTGYGIRTPPIEGPFEGNIPFPCASNERGREEIPDHNEIDNDVTKHNN